MPCGYLGGSLGGGGRSVVLEVLEALMTDEQLSDLAVHLVRRDLQPPNSTSLPLSPLFTSIIPVGVCDM